MPDQAHRHVPAIHPQLKTRRAFRHRLGVGYHLTKSFQGILHLVFSDKTQRVLCFLPRPRRSGYPPHMLLTMPTSTVFMLFRMFVIMS